MPYNIVRNDITKMDVDAIVNAGNNQLTAGGGVCGAIFSAAGYEELSEACKKLNGCKTGEAVITPGFNLKARHIIHTVGPIYDKGDAGQAKELYDCYFNSLNLAKENGDKSIAFPLISSGIYGYPKAEALQIAVSAISDFLEAENMEIYLVVFDRDSFEISKTVVSEIQSYIDEKMYSDKQSACLEANVFCAKMLAMPSFSEKAGLEEMLKSMNETFSEMLLRKIDERGLTDPEVYKKANIDRKLFSKIRNDKNYKPRKSTVLSFAIALELSLDETEDMLKLAGLALSPSNKADVIVMYFIENKNFDIFEINNALFFYDQPLLGA